MKPAEDYILRQEEPFKSILLQLQSVIEASLPEAKLLYKWRIPFYYSNGLPICYLNQSKDYIDLAFWHGDKFTKYRTEFVTENRKSVTSIRYKSIEDINDKVIIYVLQEQLRINTNPFKITRIGKAKN
ncbi:DUF1801 domain-containing protein [Winogradskyella sp.]|uniref:DUF1801 domain-containing protein n=1 Tax=Winogradskyella sp. TaxID=1883156 RepID=UPI0025E4417D|nr:DUF1801 domain-containing protein [Winogradskyella sp.]MBT8245145.1 DUF1801 domain-containing protein [Winogradskyella sp.]